MDGKQQDSSNLFFLRHGKVSLPYPSHNAMPFETLNQLAKQELDPPSDEAYFKDNAMLFDAFIKQFGFTHLFYSPSQRCVSLASHIRTLPHSLVIKAEMRPELREVRFDLTKMFSTQEAALPEVKTKLMEQLMQGAPGAESLSGIIERIHQFIQAIPRLENVLVLTHGYLMMIIAALLQSENGEVSIETLTSIPRFQYFEGFSVGQHGNIDYFSVENGYGVLTDT